MRKIAERAALAASADYADARAVLIRRQEVMVSGLSPKTIADVYDAGIGVRVLKGGARGFSSASGLDLRSAEKTAQEAVARYRL